MEAPVAEYWPAFGLKGKSEITIRQVFHHLAGIPAAHRYRQIPLWPFWPLVTADVAGLELEYLPGSQMAYHAVSWGFILGEVVRRVSGIRFEDYFDRHFAQSLGMANSWFRLPAGDFKRSPRIICGHPDQKLFVRLAHIRLIRRAVIPAASLNSTAREMAVFYQMLVDGGVYRGKRYLQAETIEQATTLAYQGWDTVNQREMLWAYGFHLGGVKNPGDPDEEESVFGRRSTHHTFGHMGNRSCMAWGDPEHRLVVTFTCNRLIGYHETRDRWREINNAVWDLIGP